MIFLSCICCRSCMYTARCTACNQHRAAWALPRRRSHFATRASQAKRTRGGTAADAMHARACARACTFGDTDTDSASSVPSFPPLLDVASCCPPTAERPAGLAALRTQDTAPSTEPERTPTMRVDSGPRASIGDQMWLERQSTVRLCEADRPPSREGHEADADRCLTDSGAPRRARCPGASARYDPRVEFDPLDRLSAVCCDQKKSAEGCAHSCACVHAGTAMALGAAAAGASQREQGRRPVLPLPRLAGDLSLCARKPVMMQLRSTWTSVSLTGNQGTTASTSS